MQIEKTYDDLAAQTVFAVTFKLDNEPYGIKVAVSDFLLAEMSEEELRNYVLDAFASHMAGFMKDSLKELIFKDGIKYSNHSDHLHYPSVSFNTWAESNSKQQKKLKLDADTGQLVVNTLRKKFPDAFKHMIKIPCKCADIGPDYLEGAIMHLNDHHLWTFEQIADWLETTDLDIRLKE